MNKLIEPKRLKSDRGRRHGLLSFAAPTAGLCNGLLGRLLLCSLLFLSLVVLAPAALAQVVDTGKNGQGSTPQPDTGASAPGSRGVGSVNGYIQRFPYAAAAYQADTLHKDEATGVMASDAGQTQYQVAYQFCLKLCDDGYGIAYFQLPMIAADTPAAARDSELFQNLMTTFGYPMSDSQFQIIQRENNQRLLELAFDPERVMWMTSSTAQTTSSQVSKSIANTGEIALNAVFNYIVNGDGNGSLINVANEGSVAGLSYRGNGDDIGVAEAVYMVQVMYKLVFIPMAVLFLLPGAVISQVKSLTARGFGMQATESQSPFDGILRSIVAVFLIPGTQVIVSWSIDTGNSLAYSCKQWVDLPTIMNWTEQLCYGPLQQVNGMLPPNPGGQQSGQGAGGGGGGGGSSLGSLGGQIGGMIGGSTGAQIGTIIGNMLGGGLGGYAGIGDGLAANVPDTQSVIEQQDWMGQALQSTLNGAMLMAAITLIILTALQVVTMCYLLLLGPISAAFYAWPQVSNTHLFRGVFGKWVDGVIKISMWRFVWMAILAIMTQRIIYMGGMPSDLKWEAAVFICFLGLMVGVPSAPFTFQPWAAFSSARQLQTRSQYSQMGMGPQGNNGTPGGSEQTAGQGGQQGGTLSNGGAQGGGGSQPAQPGGANQGTHSPTNAGGDGNSTKDGQDHQTAPPPGAHGDQSGQGAGGTPSGSPTAPHGGQPSGVPAPPTSSGAPAVAPSGGGSAGSGVPSTAAGAGSGSGTGGGSTNVNVNASTMPTSAPAVPMTPSAGSSTSNPTVATNPGAPPPAAGATPPAAPAGDGGGADGDKGAGEGASKAAGAAQGAGQGAQPDASGAIGQIAGAMGGVQPPPPSKSDDE